MRILLLSPALNSSARKRNASCSLKDPALIGIDVTRLLEILQNAEVVMPQQEPNVSRDSKDNKFLATAEEAHADYLVSEDRDLLDLVGYEGTRIIPAHKFLQILTSKREAA